MNKPTPDALKAHPSVYTYKEWNKGPLSRLYLNIRGKDRSFRGDNNTKVYYDFLTAELVIEHGKGTLSKRFLEYLHKLTNDFEHTNQ